MSGKTSKYGKYVNMADIKSGRQIGDSDAMALIELLFFAYRDFVTDPDEILEELGFGRAHHRVLHFVGRDPGLTVAELLDILKITKQSLSRVLKELIGQGYIYQKEGTEDRRQRLLYLTEKGDVLWHKLIAPQVRRFREAIAATDSKQQYHQMLFQLVNPGNRDSIKSWIERVSIVRTKE